VTAIDVLVVDKSQPLKFYFCDPSTRCHRTKRRQATVKLDGFVHHSFGNPVERKRHSFSIASFHNDGRNFFAGLAAANDTTTVKFTSTDAQDKPATERDHSDSRRNSETVGVKSQPLTSLVVNRVWHDDSQSADTAAAAQALLLLHRQSRYKPRQTTDQIRWSL
jgi:hypothetical protein